GVASSKIGFAGTGRATNDHWNLYAHYNPRFTPGAPLVHAGRLDNLKLSDGAPTAVSLSVANAPGVWGNSTGDAMYDSYIFAMNRSNIVVTLANLDPGRYNLFLYGHADPDAAGEQNSIFTVRSAGTNFGPMTVVSSAGWKAAAPMMEGSQFVVFRDLPVKPGETLVIEVAPGPNGVAVLNGLQISSKGTAPPRLVDVLPPKILPALTNLAVHSIRYDGKVGETEARFAVSLTVESQSTNDLALPLFTGDVAVLPGELPKDVRIVRGAGQYRLHVGAPGIFPLKLDVVAKITKAEPWNSISFAGPPAAIASVIAQAASAGMEVQLLSGTPLENDKNKSRVEGFLGADRLLSLRWQGKTTEITRKSLITVDTTATAQVSPTVIKFSTTLRYEILQAAVPRLTIALPVTQALTRIQGEQIRDWGTKVEGGRQLLTVEFIKPVEKSYTLALFSEQAVETTPLNAQLAPPQPLEIERESGSFTLSVDDTLVEVESVTGLRQVNAPSGALAAWRFHGRPIALAARVQRIEPVLKSTDRVTARLEETRLLVTHALALTVTKAGIYNVEFAAPTNFVVADVKGDGVEDWKVADGKLRVNFTARVLGARQLFVQLEQAHKTFPAQITFAALRPAGATKETVFIGAASSPGIRLKTGEVSNLREIPVNQLSARAGDELLAFTADAPAWTLSLATERLPARIVAEVFNLVTIGDGLVGGSATIRFGLINQGVQEFKVRLPAHWKNVEFTGPNIRRKEQHTNVWTISLQDKAWGGYTLVVTYDYQFDPKKAALDLAGAHTEGVERETGSLAVTTAASLKLLPRPVADPLRVIDPSELAETDRALITRPVLLAYRYTGANFAHTIDAARYEQERVLDAVADRTQITSVLTEAGEMLTQASFMVKNNDKQSQRFKLPAKADFWGCYVNNQPMKAERDGEWLIVSLPRGENRDEAFAVDIVYAQKLAALKAGLWPQSVQLVAPQTDVPNTYAEWELFVPPSQRATSFGGTMAIARGTTYDLRDAWQRFVFYYGDFWNSSGPQFLIGTVVVLLGVAFAGSAMRRGWKGAVEVLVVAGILIVLAGMMLPALSKAKAKASRIKSVNNLKQIGMGATVFANDHGDRFPSGFGEMMNEIGSEKVLIDPDSMQPYVWVGTGKKPGDPNALLAFSPVDLNGRNVVFADGRVEQLSSAKFNEALMNDRGTTVAQSVSQPQPNRPMSAGGPQAAPTAPPAAEPALAEERKAIIAGNFTSLNSVPANNLARLNADGSVAAGRLAIQPPAPAGGAGGFGARSGVYYNGTENRNAGVGITNSFGALAFAPPVYSVVVNDASTNALTVVSDDMIVDRNQTLTATNGVIAVNRRGGLPGVVIAGDLSFADGQAGRTVALQLDGKPVANPAASTVAGIRSIRIDLPKSGHPLTFTKVLNAGREPLTVEMSVMKAKAFATLRSLLQLAAFLAGLGLVWTEWRRVESSSLRLALGLALALGSVTHLALASRTLHYMFIAAAPVVALAVFAWIAWKLWPGKMRNAEHGMRNDGGGDAPVAPPDAPQPPASGSSSGSVPPAVAGIALFLFIGLSAVAQPVPYSADSALRIPHSAFLT
ncbi:MAG: delta-60 repeat domain-containing protein, partial [Verrucomicrobia bacterium]|nr:delta-60 repeat domain-containing protein [Verrucomicrobiota bacterium]